MRASRFGVRNENLQQQAAADLGTRAAVKRNPLAEIHRRPKHPVETGGAEKQCNSSKENDQPQCMEIDDEQQPIVQQQQQNLLAECQPQQPECEESLLAKYQQITDVDSTGDGWRDAQLVSYYAKEIFAYLRTLEPCQPIRRDYLCQPAKMDITPRMHRILFDWLVQVHQRYGLLPETLYLALHIIDYYMTLDARDINKGNYQLLGITAMFLAAKYEEIYPPDLNDFVALTERTCTDVQVRSMERKLLVRMDYFFGYPQPILFLRRYSRVSGATAEVHETAKFLAELGRCSYDLVHLPPSGLAAAAFCLAVELLAGRSSTSPQAWLPELEVFSGYSKEALSPALRLLAKTVLHAYADRQRYTAVRKKYESRSYQMVSSYPELCDQFNPVLLGYAGSTA